MQSKIVWLYQTCYVLVIETYRSNLDDTELYNLYKKYCETNNLRRDINRAVKKFREFCKLRLNT